MIPPPSWPAVWCERARYHFKVLHLAKLYASQAAQELVNIRHYLASLHKESGAEGVKRHLTEQATSREAAHPNSWQTATYKALSASTWFCNGGFDFPL